LCRVLKNIENVRCEHEPADLRQVRWRLGAFWLLDYRERPTDPSLDLLDLENSVFFDVGGTYLPDADDRPIESFRHIDQLPCDRRLTQQYVVAPEHGERLIAHRMSGRQDGV